MAEEQSQEKKRFDVATAQDIVPPPQPSSSVIPPSESTDATQPEVVNIVEKISKIITPYFVVVVGLYLCDDNFLIGIVLIGIGVASLLNVSLGDAGRFWQGIKGFLGLNK